VSKQDSQFMNIIGVVMGVLVTIAIVLLAAARLIANQTQVPDTYSDQEYIDAMVENIKPFGRVAIAGQDNSAVAIAKPPTVTAAVAGAGVTLPVPKDGAALYESTCKTCHGAGLAGAPKAGDKAAWAPRLAQGKATLYEHAIKGFTGKSGVMPPKGGRADLSDELIKQGVDYLTSLAR
jgi:cytochrome c5